MRLLGEVVSGEGHFLAKLASGLLDLGPQLHVEDYPGVDQRFEQLDKTLDVVLAWLTPVQIAGDPVWRLGEVSSSGKLPSHPVWRSARVHSSARRP